MSKSSIFKNCEFTLLQARLQGDYADPNGIFSSRVRPKLKEIKLWQQPNMKKILNQLLTQQRKRDTDEIKDVQLPQRDMSIEEFKKKHGW